jgi:hypothetical protein
MGKVGEVYFDRMLDQTIRNVYAFLKWHDVNNTRRSVQSQLRALGIGV